MKDMRRGLRAKAKKYVRTPGGRVAIHIEEEKRDFHHCSRCGAIIHGIPKEKDLKLPHSERTVQRYFGRELCQNCLEQLIRDQVYLEWIKNKALS